MTFSDRTRMAALGIGATLAAFLVFRGGARPPTPEDAVPRGSFLVASVDFAELRSSPVTEALLGGEGSRALGIGPLREACGFDPLARVERAMVSVPEETTEPGEFGVAARVQVSADELRRCVTHLAELRGAKAETREVGRFVVLESALATTDGAGPRAKGPPPRLAYGAGGMLLVGKGTWLDAMIAAAERKSPSLASSAEHGALRAALTREDGWRSPTVLVTALLPKALRDRLRTEMAAEAGADDPSGVLMGRVLGVSAVGVAIRTGSASDRVDAHAELVCDDEPACAAVEKLLGRKRLEWSRDITLRLVGLGAIADTLQVERTGTRVRVRAHASASALAGMLDRLGRPRRGPGAPP